MSHATSGESPRCQAAREAVEARLDERLPPGQEEMLREHLAHCDACRGYNAELRALRAALRSMPPFKLPADVRRRVESATRDRNMPAGPLVWRSFTRRRARAMAAALALAVCGTWWGLRAPGPEYSNAEVARAAERFEFAMALTGRALARVERVAVRDLLVDQVLPAVERVPVRWPVETMTSGEAGASR